MLRRAMTASALALLLLPAALLRADDAPKSDNLDGDWQIKSLLRGGKEPPADAPKPTLTIKGNFLTLKIGESTFKVTFKTDPTRTPKAIDMTPEDGPHKGEPIKAIYELKGDELRFCHGEPGQDRPAEFASNAEGEILAVWVRAKK